jgi:hypothetical protein
MDAEAESQGDEERRGTREDRDELQDVEDDAANELDAVREDNEAKVGATEGAASSSSSSSK